MGYSPSAPAAAPRGRVGSPRSGDNGRLDRFEECPAISNKVFVGNLSYDVTREELIQAFSAAGKVVDAKVPTDRETGRPRGFAFVEFENDDDAQKSIGLLNGRDLKGRPLRVNEAENRPPRPAGGGGDRPFRPSGGGFRPGPGPRLGGGPPPGGGFAPREDFAAAFGKGDGGRRRKQGGGSNKRQGSGSEEGRRPPERRGGAKRQRGFDPDYD